MAKPISISAKLVKKNQLTPDVIELFFESEPAFSFLPGQFVSICIPGAGPGGRDLRRAYSIASEPEKIQFELCVKVVENGPGTNYLDKLALGESFKATVPFGDFVFKPKPGFSALMIATGTGIAPFRSMIRSKLFHDHPPVKTQVLFGARDKADLLYSEEFKSILGSENFVEALSRPTGEWGGMKGRVTDYLRLNLGTIKWDSTDFYLCGNGAMIDEVKQILAAHGVVKSSIHQEIYYKPKPGESHASQEE